MRRTRKKGNDQKKMAPTISCCCIPGRQLVARWKEEGHKHYTRITHAGTDYTLVLCL